MMSSQVANPGVGVPQPGPQAGAQIHGRYPTSSPPSSNSSPAQMAYEGRLSMMTNQPPYPHQQYPSTYPQSPYTANLNFNLINNAFKQKGGEVTPNIEIPFSLPEGNLSPSSGSGSPRTDETLDKTSDQIESGHDISHEVEPLTGLEIMRQQIQQIPEQISRPQGISIRQDIQQIGTDSEEENHNVEHNRSVEIHDVEDNDEELLIDEEMDEPEVNSSNIERHEETFEEEPAEKSDNVKQFSGYQPYLNMKEGGEGINSLEKLQQVLNNRIFDNADGNTTSIVSNGNAVNGNVKVEESGEFKFILPADEEGLVYQCHLCSFTANTRVNFNAHVNTHYEFQCTKCDWEDKTEASYCRHLKEEHNCTPEDLEEAEVRVPRVNSQGKVKTFKCKQCEFVAVTKLEFWKHGRGHIKPEKLLFCPKCIFVTEYKHHLEYHLRNHYGTKPFKCTHCNYSCVNKSMLNSHMKSHTNVYQYRCADCTYATKYCHSLKLHLKKYAHKPAMVLNNDGSPNGQMPPMDMFGNKRGPKNGKGGREEQGMFPTLLPQFPPNFSNLPNLPNLPNLSNFPPHFMAQMQLHHLQSQFGTPPKIAQVSPFRLDNPIKKEERGVSPPMMEEPENLRCDKCEFSTSSSEVYKNHVSLHASSERGALHRLLTSPQQNRHRHDQSSDELSFSPLMRSQSPSSPRSPFPQRPLFMDRPESPTSSTGNFPASSLAYFNKIAIANPLLQGLVPNPAIKALMEERRKEGSIPSSPESFRNESPHSREEAPLPPNKRLKTDIFASLYASKMSELAEKGESPSGVLDLSKECNDTIIGGGSHGSSSDNESGSNPRSHSSSPSLSSTTTKNRRKGKAFKLQRFDNDTNSEEDVSTIGSPAMPSLMPISRSSNQSQETFSNQASCKFCGISFRNSVMHSIHMGYHGCREPFKCNLCGDECDDALSFFLHIARKEHR